MNKDDEVVIVKTDGENLAIARLLLIQKTNNIYIKKLEENPEMRINMSAYCSDVYFLLTLIHKMNEYFNAAEVGNEHQSLKK